MMDLSALAHEIYVARRTLFEGFITTMEISGLVIAIGTVFGVLIGLGLCYGHFLLRLVLRAYVDFIRGIPALVLIFFCFYGTL